MAKLAALFAVIAAGPVAAPMVPVNVESPPPMCVSTVKMAAETVHRARPECWVDEKVSKNAGVLRYPCGGGPATLSFGTWRFVGTVTDGRIDVALSSRFDWQDGCTWQSNQRISGALRSRELSYEYSEHPISGSGCFRPCGASATVRVTELPQ